METQRSPPCQSLVNLENGDLNTIEGEKPEHTAQKILKEIAEDIRTLRKDKATLENLVKSRTQEVESYKDRVTCYQKEYENIQETLISVQKRLVEKEDFRKFQEVKISNLEQTSKETESTLQSTQKFCQELVKKHNKLREFSAMFVTDLQNVILNILLRAVSSKDNFKESSSGETLYDRLATMRLFFNDKITKLESSRKDLQETSKKNQQMVLVMLNILQNIMDKSNQSTNPNSKLAKNKIRARIICCNLCGKRMISRQKLLEHRRNVHAVQNAKKLVQRKRSQKIKLVLKKTGCQWNIATSHENYTQELGNFHHKVNQSMDHNSCNNGEMPIFSSISGSNSSNSEEAANTTLENEHSNKPYSRDSPPEENNQGVQEAGNFHHEPTTKNSGNIGMPIFPFVLQSNSSISEESATSSTPTEEYNIPNSAVSEDPPSDEMQYPGGGCSCCGINITNPPNLDPMSSANPNAAFLVVEAQTSSSTIDSAPVKHGLDHSRLQQDFKCPYCPNSYIHSSELKAHLLGVNYHIYPNFQNRWRQNPVLPNHVEPIFSSLRTPTAFAKHCGHTFQGSEGPNILLCRCGTKFGNWDTLNAHIRFFAMRKSFSCFICNANFTSFRGTNEHLEKIHNVQVDPNYMGCETCGVVFANREEYSRHMIATGNKDAQFICSMEIFTQRSTNTVNANAITSNESSASQAIRPESPIPLSAFKPVQPTPKSDFACQICGKRFLYASDFRLHMDMAHKLLQNFDSSSISCKACGKLFVNDVDIYNHFCTSHVEFGEQSHNTQMLTTPSMPMSGPNLAQHPPTAIDHVHNTPPWKHGRIHKPLPVNPLAKELVYQCSCGEMFHAENSRKRHIRRRNIARIFVCSWCPARFDRYSILRNHVKVCHPGCAEQMAKYACTTCAKPFSTRQEMYLHKASEHSNVQI